MCHSDLEYAWRVARRLRTKHRQSRRFASSRQHIKHTNNKQTAYNNRQISNSN